MKTGETILSDRGPFSHYHSAGIKKKMPAQGRQCSRDPSHCLIHNTVTCAETPLGCRKGNTRTVLNNAQHILDHHGFMAHLYPTLM